MKFKHLSYSKDEEVFLFFAEYQIQLMAKELIGRNLEPRELMVLEKKIHTEIENLIIKIDSSGTAE